MMFVHLGQLGKPDETCQQILWEIGIASVKSHKDGNFRPCEAEMGQKHLFSTMKFAIEACMNMTHMNIVLPLQ